MYVQEVLPLFIHKVTYTNTSWTCSIIRRKIGSKLHIKIKNQIYNIKQQENFNFNDYFFSKYICTNKKLETLSNAGRRVFQILFKYHCCVMASGCTKHLGHVVFLNFYIEFTLWLPDKEALMQLRYFTRWYLKTPCARTSMSEKLSENLCEWSNDR